MRAWFRLVRLPNTLTTTADVVAGYAVARAVSDRATGIQELFGAAIAAMMLYAFGMALNDFVDREKDAVLHPYRPLPSGAIDPERVRWLLGLFALAPLAIAWFLGVKVFLAAGALVLAIVAYDLLVKELALGAALAMGLCRALAMSLGVALAGGWGDPHVLAFVARGWQVWVLPLAYGVLIAGVTLVSIWEERPAGRLFRSAVWVLLLFAYLSPSLLPWAPIAIGAAALMLYLAVVSPVLRDPPAYGLVVRNAIFSLVLWTGLVALGAGDLPAAAFCVLLFPVIRGLALLIGQRGS